MQSAIVPHTNPLQKFIADYLPTKQDFVDFVIRYKRSETEPVETVFFSLTLTQIFIFVVFGEALFTNQPSLKVMASLGSNVAWAICSIILLFVRGIGILKRNIRLRKMAAFMSMCLWYLASAALIKGGAVYMGLMYVALATNTAGVFLRLTKRMV